MHNTPPTRSRLWKGSASRSTERSDAHDTTLRLQRDAFGSAGWRETDNNEISFASFEETVRPLRKTKRGDDDETTMAKEQIRVASSYGTPTIHSRSPRSPTADRHTAPTSLPVPRVNCTSTTSDHLLSTPRSTNKTTSQPLSPHLGSRLSGLALNAGRWLALANMFRAIWTMCRSSAPSGRVCIG